MRNDLPLLYRWLRAHGLTGLRPWHFIDSDERVERLREEYQLEVGGTKDIIPQAQGQPSAGGILAEGNRKGRVRGTLRRAEGSLLEQ